VFPQARAAEMTTSAISLETFELGTLLSYRSRLRADSLTVRIKFGTVLL